MLDMELLWSKFLALGKEALVMNHYDLNEVEKDIKVGDWKTFLMTQEVKDWIASELKLIHSSELNKLVENVSTSRSVGQAQLLNSLQKFTEENDKKEGPAFIYSYVPVNPDEEKAPNLQTNKKDVFKVET